MSPISTQQVRYLSGDSTIDIRGNNKVSEFRLLGREQGLAWLAEMGTTIEKLIKFCHPRGEDQLREFRSTLLKNFDVEEMIRSIEPFLAPGEYRILIVDYLNLVAYLDESSSDINAPNGFYGFCSMVATQPRSDLREDTVRWFQKQLEEGERPLALGICVNVSWVNDPEEDIGTVFILDGHHRLEAYGREGIKPQVCVLARIAPPPPSEGILNIIQQNGD